MPLALASAAIMMTAEVAVIGMGTGTVMVTVAATVVGTVAATVVGTAVRTGTRNEMRGVTTEVRVQYIDTTFGQHYLLTDHLK